MQKRRGGYATGIVLAVLLLAAGTLTFGGAGETASGRLENGLRVLSGTDLEKPSDITVFRGDYIKFEVDAPNGVRFQIPSLDIDATLFPDIEKSPYFKMKQAGDFGYVLGQIKGTLHVVEYEGTHYQALTARQAQKIIKNLNPLILDVRTPAEFKLARIEGARLLPVQVLEQNLSRLSGYSQEPVLVYCATGNRSTVASKILIDNGFVRIFNLKKGIKDWQQQGLPVVNSSP